MMVAWKGKLVSKIEGTWPQDVVVGIYIYIPNLETIQRILFPHSMRFYPLITRNSSGVLVCVQYVLRSAAVFCHDRLQSKSPVRQLRRLCEACHQ